MEVAEAPRWDEHKGPGDLAVLRGEVFGKVYRSLWDMKMPSASSLKFCLTQIRSGQEADAQVLGSVVECLRCVRAMCNLRAVCRALRTYGDSFGSSQRESPFSPLMAMEAFAGRGSSALLAHMLSVEDLPVNKPVVGPRGGERAIGVLGTGARDQRVESFAGVPVLQDGAPVLMLLACGLLLNDRGGANEAVRLMAASQADWSQFVECACDQREWSLGVADRKQEITLQAQFWKFGERSPRVLRAGDLTALHEIYTAATGTSMEDEANKIKGKSKKQAALDKLTQVTVVYSRAATAAPADVRRYLACRDSSADSDDDSDDDADDDEEDANATALAARRQEGHAAFVEHLSGKKAWVDIDKLLQVLRLGVWPSNRNVLKSGSALTSFEGWSGAAIRRLTVVAAPSDDVATATGRADYDSQGLNECAPLAPDAQCVVKFVFRRTGAIRTSVVQTVLCDLHGNPHSIEELRVLAGGRRDQPDREELTRRIVQRRGHQWPEVCASAQHLRDAPTAAEASRAEQSFERLQNLIR